MRVILVALTIIIFLILSLPAYFILWIVGKFDLRRKAAISQKIIKGAFRVTLFAAGTKITALGQENVPKDEAVLYVGNHRGLADIPLGYITVPTLTGFVAKQEIRKIPIFPWWMKNLNCLFLDRSDMRKGLETILSGVELMKNGYSIFIMPEGTRNRGNELDLLPFKEGSLKMAEKSNCAIIPVAISNTAAVFEEHIPWVKKAHVIIHYGKPIYPANLPREEKKHLGVFVRASIIETLKQDASLLARQ